MKKTNKVNSEATLDLGASETAAPTTLKPDSSESAEPAAVQKKVVMLVELSDGTIERLATAIASQLRQMMPLHARLCAADTIRTSERPDTVFRHAIKEAAIAQGEIKKHLQSATVAD